MIASTEDGSGYISGKKARTLLMEGLLQPSGARLIYCVKIPLNGPLKVLYFLSSSVLSFSELDVQTRL